MGEERHAYGTSLFCVPRRLFVLFFAALMTVLCYLHIISWIFQWNWFYYLRTGSDKDTSVLGCIGTQCYEVFSCYGMKDASQNMREPFTTLAGAIAFPLGVAGAHLGDRTYLGILRFYLACSACLHIFLIIWDAVYLDTCSSYSRNMIMQVLLPTIRFPFHLITLAAQEQLRDMTAFPIGQVDDITNGVNINAWYFTFASVWAVFLSYVALESHWLANIMERGPLGLGVHYGLAQWDEVLDHETIRRHKEKQTFSKFIDDARLPLEKDVESSVRGYMVSPGNYGSFDPEPDAIMPGVALMQEQQYPYEAEAEAVAWGTGAEPYLEQEAVDEAVDDRDNQPRYTQVQEEGNVSLDQPPSSPLEVPVDEQGRPLYEEDRSMFEETSPASIGGPFSIGGSSVIPGTLQGNAVRSDYA